LTPLTYPTLRAANSARHLEWTNNQTVELTWRGTELAGEIGELAELLLASVGSATTSIDRDALCDEIGDGMICLDLTAMTADIADLTISDVAYMTRTEMAAALGVAVCRACNTLKKLEREHRGWPGSRTTKATLHSDLSEVASLIEEVAKRFNVDTAAVTARKFNATSEKVGLRTRLAT
jgi:NTP pyrophosphatase (non-canonical NTP hydrolase)